MAVPISNPAPPQNIYDNPAFFEGYSNLPRSTSGLTGALEWPILQTYLPPLQGLKVLDLGCGYGHFSRWARDQGAVKVLGIDVSDSMLEKARELAPDSAQDSENVIGKGELEFRKEDLETWTFGDRDDDGKDKGGVYDVAFSSLSLHYIANFPRLLVSIHRAVKAGGKLIFSIEHPIFSASLTPGWIVDAQGKRKWGVDSYMLEGPRTTDWFGEKVIRYHRTLGTLLGDLIKSGWRIEGVRDFGPDLGMVERGEVKGGHWERPVFLLVCAGRE